MLNNKKNNDILLHIVMRSKHQDEYCAMFLRNMENLLAKNYNGETPLDCACKQKRDMLPLLFKIYDILVTFRNDHNQNIEFLTDDSELIYNICLYINTDKVTGFKLPQFKNKLIAQTIAQNINNGVNLTSIIFEIFKINPEIRNNELEKTISDYIKGIAIVESIAKGIGR